MINNNNNGGLGCFYGVGVGPGDPGLLTLKAQRLLQRIDVICFTQLDNGEPSFALGVLKEVLLDASPEYLSITIPSDDSQVAMDISRAAAAAIAGH